MTRLGEYLAAKIREATDTNYAVLTSPDSAANNAMIYADALTMLFEGAARVLEIHQPLVAAYYGQQHMPALIACIQPECDRQCVRICDAFVKHRQLTQRLRRAQQKPKSKKTTTDTTPTDDVDPLLLDQLLSEVRLLQLCYHFFSCHLCKRARPCTPDLRDARPKWRMRPTATMRVDWTDS